MRIFDQLLGRSCRVGLLVDAGLRRIGQVASWCVLLLLVAIVVQVVARYGFRHGSIKLEELQWHLYAIAVMVGLSYAHCRGVHIRVDVLHHRLGPRTRAVIDIVGTLVLLLPFLGFLFVQSLPFVWHAFKYAERSNFPSGLPMRWIIKAMIPLGCLLLAVAAMSHLVRCLAALRKS